MKGMIGIAGAFIDSSVEDPRLQVQIVDVGAIQVSRICQPLEVGQEVLGDVGPDLISRLKGPVFRGIHGKLGTMACELLSRLENPGQEGVEHAVVGSSVDHSFPVLVK
jgi:hypothetical protein